MTFQLSEKIRRPPPLHCSQPVQRVIKRFIGVKLLITPVPVFSPAIKTHISSPGDCIFIPLTSNYDSDQREVVAVTATHSADITARPWG